MHKIQQRYNFIIFSTNQRETDKKLKDRLLQTLMSNVLFFVRRPKLVWHWSNWQVRDRKITVQKKDWHGQSKASLFNGLNIFDVNWFKDVRICLTEFFSSIWRRKWQKIWQTIYHLDLIIRLDMTRLVSSRFPDFSYLPNFPPYLNRTQVLRVRSLH